MRAYAWTACIALLILTNASALAQPQPPPPLAGVVVQFGDGTVRTACVDLGGPERTGIELLRRAGIDLVTEVTMLGEQVCRIGREGCDFPAQSCWCRCENLGLGDCAYWSYNVLRDGRWAYAMLGPSSRTVRPGDVDGWAWGRGTVVVGTQPPVRTFEEICAEALAPPAVPTGAPIPTPDAATPITAGAIQTTVDPTAVRPSSATSTPRRQPTRPAVGPSVQSASTTTSSAALPSRSVESGRTATATVSDPGRAAIDAGQDSGEAADEQVGEGAPLLAGRPTAPGVASAGDRGIGDETNRRDFAGYIVFGLVAALLVAALLWLRR